MLTYSTTPMIYTLEQIIDDRNRDLYEQVKSKVMLEFHEQSKADEQEGWGSRYDPDRGVGLILCAPTRFPHSSFTHELLHIQYELEGYQRPRHLAVKERSSEIEAYEQWAKTFFVWAYNQLMHQRMLPQFIALGFPEDQFLRENRGRLDKLQNHVKEIKSQKTKHDLDREYFVRTYLSLCNPNDNPKIFQRLLDELSCISRPLFTQIEDFTNKWIGADFPDVSWYLARLFNICGHPNVGVGNSPETLIWASICLSNR